MSTQDESQSWQTFVVASVHALNPLQQDDLRISTDLVHHLLSPNHRGFRAEQ